MVMELADRQLGDRFNECRQWADDRHSTQRIACLLARKPPKALDVIGTKFGLQHLDVKPGNLFLTGGHVQVGDYGLVSKSTDGKKGTNRGLTPRYSPPEVLYGEVHVNPISTVWLWFTASCSPVCSRIPARTHNS